MKSLTTASFLVLLTCFAAASFAQAKRGGESLLFANAPKAVACTEKQLASLFDLPEGSRASLSLDTQLTLEGTITTNIKKYSNLQTIVLRMPAFKNSMLSLSRQLAGNITVKYVGRILNPLYADGFELKRGTGGDYRFEKIDVRKIVVDCRQQ